MTQVVPVQVDFTQLHRPLPRSCLGRPAARASGRSRRPPSSSSSRAGHGPRTTGENYHRAAPVRRNAPCAPAARDGATVSGRDSTARRPTSSGATCRAARDAIFTGQMLGGQGRAKPLVNRPAVLLPHERHYPLALRRRPRVIRNAARASMLQALRPFRRIPPRQTLRLAIAHGHQRRRRSQTQRPRFHAAQYLDPAQLSRTHPCPSQRRLPWRSSA
jgi:hypothetical protein